MGGRVLLSTGLVAHSLLLVAIEGRDGLRVLSHGQEPPLVIVNLGVDLLLVYYLWRSALVRDVFADFPRKPAGKR